MLCDSFKHANLDTGLIQREEAFLLNAKPEVATETVVAAALIDVLSRIQNNKAANNAVWQKDHFWRLNQQNAHTVQLQCNDQTLKIQLKPCTSGFEAHYNGQTLSVQGELLDAHRLQLCINGQQQKMAFNQHAQGITLFQNGQRHVFSYVKRTLTAMINKTMPTI